MKILCVGDQLTLGYVCDTMKYRYPYSTVLKNNHSIDILAKMHRRVFSIRKDVNEHLNNHKYDIVIVLTGSNNLATNDKEYIYKKIIDIHNVIHHTNTKSIVLSIPEKISMKTNKCLYDKKRNWINNKLCEWCENNENAIYVPYGENFRYDYDMTLWSGDGTHMSPKGYRKVGEFISDYIK